MHKTKDLNDGYVGSGKLLRRAIKKYGVENFSTVILHVFDQEWKMKVAEKILVVTDSEVSYNLCSGGHGGFGYINSTEEIVFKRDKRENKIKGRIASNISILKKYGVKNPGQLEKNRKKSSIRFKALWKEGKLIRPDWTGKKHSEETKQKIGKANRGSKNSQYGTCWITNGQESRKIKKNDLDNWLEKGYHKGRKIKS